MARGPPLTDAHRVLLILIFKHYPELKWQQAAEVFNAVFHQENRTQRTLESHWSRRNNSQQKAWEEAWGKPEAGHDLTTRDQWLQAIATAVAELDDSDRSQITKKSQHTLKWNYKMRLVLYLLHGDKSLSSEERSRIINTLFRDLLRKQNAEAISEPALRSQWSKRIEVGKSKAEVIETQDDEGTSPKHKQSSRRRSKPSAVSDWQRILDGPQTEKDRATLAKWQGKIKEQKDGLVTSPDQTFLERSPQGESEEETADKDGSPGKTTSNRFGGVLNSRNIN